MPIPATYKAGTVICKLTATGSLFKAKRLAEFLYFWLSRV